MLTGEAMPVEKSPGDKVTGGTVNQTGSFLMEAERVGSETVLARIVEMVAQAQRSRAPIQRLADKVAAWFVPAVIAVAVITFIAWAWLGPEPRSAYAIVNSVAVLIIACPCALGLATPMSIMVGVGRGAQAGLVKNAEAMELMEKIDTLVVDKTGTLTEGKPHLTTVVASDWVNVNDLLAAAAAIEELSEHPIASAIVLGAQDRHINLGKVTNFHSITGGGVSGTVDDRSVIVGKPEFLHAQGVRDLEKFGANAGELQAEGNTVIFVAIEGRAAGILAVSDPIKESAPTVVQGLHQLGIKIIMLTGDNERTARAVAKIRHRSGRSGRRASAQTSASRDSVAKVARSQWRVTVSTTPRRSPPLT
jgi:Cu+-exporting ATPase